MGTHKQAALRKGTIWESFKKSSDRLFEAMVLFESISLKEAGYHCVGVSLSRNGDGWRGTFRLIGEDGNYVVFVDSRSIPHVFLRYVNLCKGGQLEPRWDKYRNAEEPTP